MPFILRPKDFNGRLTLRQCRNKVGFRCCSVHFKIALTNTAAITHTRIDNNTVNRPKFLLKGLKNRKHIIIMRHIQYLNLDLNRKLAL